MNSPKDRRSCRSARLRSATTVTFWRTPRTTPGSGSSRWPSRIYTRESSYQTMPSGSTPWPGPTTTRRFSTPWKMQRRSGDIRCTGMPWARPEKTRWYTRKRMSALTSSRGRVAVRLIFISSPAATPLRKLVTFPPTSRWRNGRFSNLASRTLNTIRITTATSFTSV